MINAPEIDGYRFVGVIEMEGVCLIDPTPTPTPTPEPQPENEDNNYVTVKPGTPSPASSPIMSPFIIDFSDQFEDEQKDELKKLTDLV